MRNKLTLLMFFLIGVAVGIGVTFAVRPEVIVRNGSYLTLTP